MKRYEINLISDRKQQQADKQKASSIARIIAVFCVVLLAISAIGLFLIKTSLANSQLNPQEQAELQKLNALHQKLVTISLVSNRMATINTILQSRAQYDVPIGVILAAAPSEISFTSFSVNKQSITFSITSNSLEAIDTFFGNLTTLVTSKKYFRLVTLQSLNSNNQGGNTSSQSGQYSASLTIEQL